MAGADGAAILVPVPVEDPMMRLHAPVPPVKGQQARGVGALGGVVRDTIDRPGGGVAGFFSVRVRSIANT